MSGHVRTDRFRWGHDGTGCSGRTVLVGTGLDRAEQVVTCFYMFGHVGTGRYSSGYFATDLSVQDVHVVTGRHRSGLVETIRVQVGTCPDMSGLFGKVHDSS
jgi:hypothetical protein